MISGLGFEREIPVQTEAIPAILAGENVLIISSTVRERQKQALSSVLREDQVRGRNQRNEADLRDTVARPKSRHAEKDRAMGEASRFVGGDQARRHIPEGQAKAGALPARHSHYDARNAAGPSCRFEITIQSIKPEVCGYRRDSPAGFRQARFASSLSDWSVLKKS